MEKKIKDLGTENPTTFDSLNAKALVQKLVKKLASERWDTFFSPSLRQHKEKRVKHLLSQAHSLKFRGTCGRSTHYKYYFSFQNVNFVEV